MIESLVFNAVFGVDRGLLCADLFLGGLDWCGIISCRSFGGGDGDC